MPICFAHVSFFIVFFFLNPEERFYSNSSGVSSICNLLVARISFKAFRFGVCVCMFCRQTGRVLN